MHILPVYQLIQDLHVVGIGPIILLCLKEEPQADTLQNLRSVPLFKLYKLIAVIVYWLQFVVLFERNQKCVPELRLQLYWE